MSTIPLEDQHLDTLGKTQRGLGFDEASPLAIVGDAIFAGSMGGGNVSFAGAFATNARHILTLADATVLTPGHGPLTTLGEEKTHHPFLAR